VSSALRDLVLALAEEELREFVLAQRWYGSKSDEVAHVRAVDAFPLREDGEPLLAVAVVETRFQTGTHELYNLPVGMRRGRGGFASADGWSAFDALEDETLVRELVELIRAQEVVEHAGGTLHFSTVGGPVGDELGAVRPIGSEQSNTSVVLGERLVLKLYRRLEAGVNPELELLRFLTERGFPAIASLEGWAVHVGQPLDATLAILQDYVPERSDGWTLALDDLARGSSENDFVPRARRLGEVTGELHSVLASEPNDPAFNPEEASAEALALIVARIDEEIEQVFSSLPDDPRVEPLTGRGEELRVRLQALGMGEPLGRLIRHHGDYHLGQVIWTERGDWVVLDFEGEPARPLHERRHKRSPLRDVAGMLRSFSYAASASSLERGIEPPIGWEGHVREEFLAGYLDRVDPAIVPSGPALDRRLRLFELEKALYELHYELGHRPDWVRVPVAGILQLLEEPA
jgi:maltokinase